MPLPPPDIFSTLDHRTWLEAWFDWKKVQNPRFSHRMFARMAGHKSPSLLLLVMQGKRNLTPKTTEGFIRATGLEGEAAGFFRLLVHLEAADRADERNEIFARIAASQRFQAARRIEGEAFGYLSQWYLPAIRELATLPGFRPDPHWIARTLHPPIRTSQAQAALASLQALGMLVLHADGGVEVRDGTLATPHEVTGLAVHNYHQGMLERAADAISTVGPSDRHLGSVTIAIPSSQIGALKAEVAAFLERFLDRCEKMDQPADRIYQLGAQLFPLSRALPPEDPTR